jgi:hypothetical protein
MRREEPGARAHVARAALVVHDPSGLYQGSLPMQRIVDGLLVQATRRVVPALGSHGRGFAVVPA